MSLGVFGRPVSGKCMYRTRLLFRLIPQCVLHLFVYLKKMPIVRKIGNILNVQRYTEFNEDAYCVRNVLAGFLFIDCE